MVDKDGGGLGDIICMETQVLVKGEVSSFFNVSLSSVSSVSLYFVGKVDVDEQCGAR